MSDQITINVVPDSFVTVTAEEGNENVYLNSIAFFTEAEADARYVNLINNQNISGIKNFTTNPQFQGVNLATELYSIAMAIALG